MTVNVILPKERQIEWLNAYILLWDISNTEMNPAGYSAEQIEEHLVKLYRQFCSIQKLPLMSADELILHISPPPPVKYARKCSITGVGMNEGYCFNDGEEYAATPEAAEQVARNLGYENLTEAQDAEIVYWTQWEDKEDYFYQLTQDGQLIYIEQ